MIVSEVTAQTFNSGSDGTDGALIISTPGTSVFDPSSFTPLLDPDGDGVYHFTTVMVSTGVTVRFDSAIMGNKPVVWLATGNVQIDGTLDLGEKLGTIFRLLLYPFLPNPVREVMLEE
ncbi:MAG: hypothetical protein GKR87_02395 [Kiritimatiellae bacterium]|nr:hypothetical protein [Kiritimatiellia bacterium]